MEYSSFKGFEDETSEYNLGALLPCRRWIYFYVEPHWSFSFSFIFLLHGLVFERMISSN